MPPAGVAAAALVTMPAWLRSPCTVLLLACHPSGNDDTYGGYVEVDPSVYQCFLGLPRFSLMSGNTTLLTLSSPGLGMVLCDSVAVFVVHFAAPPLPLHAIADREQNSRLQ